MHLQHIKTLCEKRKGGLRGLAVFVGMTEQNLHRCIRENKIQAQDLEKIAQALQIPISYFFDEDAPKVETFVSTGRHGIQAKYIGSIDNRDMTKVDEKVEIEEIEEEIILPPDCPDKTKYAVEKLKLRIEMLEQLLAEKERFINHLLSTK